MSYKRIDDSTLFQSQCVRCGYVFVFNERSLFRGVDLDRCASCKAEPAATVTVKGVRCQPWHGDFDLDNNWPLKDGQPHLVGPRSCGNADCVRPLHLRLQALAG